MIHNFPLMNRKLSLNSNGFPRIILLFFLFFKLNFLFCQISSRFDFVEDYQRRHQLFQSNINKSSFFLRPINQFEYDSILNDIIYSELIVKEKFSINLINLNSVNGFGFGPPYLENSPLIVSKGLQSSINTGFVANIGPIYLQFSPEFFYSKNSFYETGVVKTYSTEFLERYGIKSFKKVLLGQSSAKLNFGSFSVGISNENIWWGPGQFNSLIFSYNAFGFKHLTLNTIKPAKTFLGNFEGQIILGRLEGSEFFFKPNEYDESRYLNGFTFSYNPNLLPNMFLGLSRVFQVYQSNLASNFSSYFPIFEAFQKQKLGSSNLGQFNSFDYDQIGQDQQLSGFIRYLVKPAKMELYFEYGKNDHSFNWRDAILNPEHSRAYLLGFSKVIGLKNNSGLQLNGEILQQQESINLLVRGADLREIGDRSNWGGHYPISHGFTHLGQMLGPAVGPSSNVQTFEIIWFEGLRKVGIRFERLNRHQDRYNKLFFNPSENKRWIDFSSKILVDWQWNNLILSSSINFVNSINYQWNLGIKSSAEFPTGENLFSFNSNISLIYLLKKK